MNRFFWLLNGTLLAAALLMTLVAYRFEPAPSAASARPDAVGDEARPARGATGRRAALDSRTAARGPSQSMVDTIWKQSLFRPDRGEDGAEGVAGADAAQAGDMELVGIGQINDEGAAIILLQNSGAAVPGAMPMRRPDAGDGSAAMGAGRRFGAGAAASRRPVPGRRAAAGASASGGQTHVFRINQRVGGTGFVVKEIRLDSVLLVRGGEERLLKLDAGDASSRARHETATRDAAAREAAATRAATPPPPTDPAARIAAGLPPMPPMPGAPGGGMPGMPGAAGGPAATPGAGAAAVAPVFPASREERIRTALEAARRRQLENPRGGIPPAR